MSSHPKRIDLHCHSSASNQTGEAMLNAIRCPESYSNPEEVYLQARMRGMDFVTLTDHDSIQGALEISHKHDVLVGEELTCWFPEDSCKMHVLVFGIDHTQHAALQHRSRNIYDVAEYVEANRIAHAVAHPIYRQNDKLERWHLERLILMFKGFECLNGAHSPLHREAFEPLMDRLDRSMIARLSETHALTPRWPQPWVKARTGGSDDHGLLNVGRTWTEFPPDTGTTDDVLRCLREGLCRAGGEAGSSAKLAHTIYSVAVRYYTNHLMAPDQKPNLATTLLQTLSGQRRAPSKLALLRLGLGSKLKRLTRRVTAPLSKPAPEPEFGTARFKKLFMQSAMKQLKKNPQIIEAAQQGLPPLGEHERIIEMMSHINRDIAQGLAHAITKSLDDASFTGLFDSIGACAAHQFTQLPYYFAVFHQNKERHLLRGITGLRQPRTASTMKVGLFTDTFDDANGVARFLRDTLAQAESSGRQLIVHTCCEDPQHAPGGRKNFLPLLTRELPYYSELKLSLPPLLDVLEWADRQQFDAVHISTPGPMGLCGWVVSRMLRVPMLATYHTDFPAYVDRLARDHRITNGTIAYMKWFYDQASAVFARSSAYRFNLGDLGVGESKLRGIVPAIDLNKFTPSPTRAENTQLRLLYCGRVSIEKNLKLLVDTFAALTRKRPDVKLIIAGDGPYRAEMQQALHGLPAQFLGYQDDPQLVELYNNCDLLIFPSRTDTLGQVVMEAQACGLPAIVTNEGGPKETVDHNVTGLVMTSTDVSDWCAAIEQLLDDAPRRRRMSRAASARMSGCSLEQSFESFWNDHLALVEPATAEPDESPLARV